MPDYSEPLQLLVVCVALGSSIWVGWLKRGPRNFGKIASSVFLALAWGFCFTFMAVYFNGMCRTTLNLCAERGDGNMTYWFLPLFATPIYLIFMLAFGTRGEPLVIGSSPYDKAVDAAVVQLQSQNKIHQRCPGCNALIFAEPVEATKSAAKKRVYLRCACSKCDRLFELHINKA